MDYCSCPSFKVPPCPNINEALEKSIRGEAEAICFYTRLMTMAPDRFQKDIIAKIRGDEEKHLQNFQAAYCQVNKHTYTYPEPRVEAPPSYRDGLFKAFQDEQEAYEFYKTNFLCNYDQTIKYVYLDALMDEAEHARWFNNLLIRTQWERSSRHHNH